VQGRQHTHGEDPEDDQEGVRQELLRLVDDVVAHQRDHEADHGDHGHPHLGAAVHRGVQGLTGEDRVEDVEARVLHIREQPHQQGAHVTELGPRLDHLRQSELRALGRVEGHEEGAEQGARDDRDERPDEVAALGDADQADGEGGDLRVRHEPQGPQVPQLAVALVEGHIVDGTYLQPGHPGL
jgi:hypothetical protein